MPLIPRSRKAFVQGSRKADPLASPAGLHALSVSVFGPPVFVFLNYLICDVYWRSLMILICLYAVNDLKKLCLHVLKVKCGW